MRFRHVPVNGIFTVEGIEFLKTGEKSAVSENGNDIPFFGHKIVCYVKPFEMPIVGTVSQPQKLAVNNKKCAVAVRYIENGKLESWFGIYTNDQITAKLAEIRKVGKITFSMFRPVSKNLVKKIHAGALAE